MIDKKQTTFLRPFGVILLVFAVRELAGIFARMIGSRILEKIQVSASLGLYMTGITALFTFLLLWPIYWIGIQREQGCSDSRPKILDWILLIPFSICASLGVNQFLNLFHLVELSQSYERTSQVLFSGTRMISVLILGCLVPAAEEVMFRGLIFRHFESLLTKKSAIFFSALLFGVYHGNLVQGIYACVIGLFLAFVYEWFGSLFAPFLFHSVANIFVYFAADIDILGQNGGIVVSCALGIVGMILFFVYYSKKYNKL